MLALWMFFACSPAEFDYDLDVTSESSGSEVRVDDAIDQTVTPDSGTVDWYVRAEPPSFAALATIDGDTLPTDGTDWLFHAQLGTGSHLVSVTLDCLEVGEAAFDSRIEAADCDGAPEPVDCLDFTADFVTTNVAITVQCAEAG